MASCLQVRSEIARRGIRLTGLETVEIFDKAVVVTVSLESGLSKQSPPRAAVGQKAAEHAGTCRNSPSEAWRMKWCDVMACGAVLVPVSAGLPLPYQFV